jgi:hypothetical protein
MVKCHELIIVLPQQHSDIDHKIIDPVRIFTV